MSELQGPERRLGWREYVAVGRDPLQLRMQNLVQCETSPDGPTPVSSIRIHLGQDIHVLKFRKGSLEQRCQVSYVVGAEVESGGNPPDAGCVWQEE